MDKSNLKHVTFDQHQKGLEVGWIDSDVKKFIFCSINKCAKVFKILKNQKTFEWIVKYAKVFYDLKRYSNTPSILSKSKNRESLYIYFVIFEHAVSLVLVWIEDKT